MKKIFLAILIIAFSITAQAAENSERVIIVSATGEVEVPVDNVILYVNTTTENKDSATAKSEGEKKYQEILSTLEKLGVGKNSIKSNHVSINPVYRQCPYDPKGQQAASCDRTAIEYYSVNRSLSIKLDDLKKYDSAIDSLSKVKGANVSTGAYDIVDKVKPKDEARDKAIDSAKQKATKIAGKLGVKLGRPARFESYDETSSGPRPVMMRMANATMEGSGAAATDTEALGKIKVVVTVTIAYEME